MKRLSIILERWQRDFYNRLNPRERLLILGAGAFLSALLLTYLFHFIITRRIEMREEAGRIRGDYARLLRMKALIQELPRGAEAPDANQLKALLYTKVEKAGLKADIRDHLESLSRTEEMIVVDINFTGASMKSIFDLLYEVEYGGGVPARVGRCTIRRALPDREIYDGNISLQSIRVKEK